MSTQAPRPNPHAPLSGAARTVSREPLLAIIWVCFSIATLFLILRLIVRWRQNGVFLADDYWMTCAWACMLTMVILQTEQMDALWYMTYLGAGRLVPDPQEMASQSHELTRWQFPIITLFWITLWSVKASFMAIFFRLIHSFPILRRLWYCVAVFAALALIGCILASTFTCSPPSDYFNGNCNSPHEKWMQGFNVIYSTSVDIATDLMIMGLPIAALPSLQLDLRKKIGLGVVFGVGAIIICVAIVRMTQVVTGNTVDLIGLAIWGAVETATSVIVGSLPPLKGLITRRAKKYHSTKRSTGNKYGQEGLSNRSKTGDRYAHGTTSRAAMASESIPLDDMHRSSHLDGGIYVQKTFTTRVEKDDSSKGESDELAIIDERHVI